MKSQRELIRKHLIKRRTITHRQAEDLYGCTRLAARIKELREEFGQDSIYTGQQWHKCKATGREGWHALYILDRGLTNGGKS